MTSAESHATNVFKFAFASLRRISKEWDSGTNYLETALGINPTTSLNQYIENHELVAVHDSAYVFCNFMQFAKVSSDKQLTVKTWNKRLPMIQKAANTPRRTSHAIRAIAISLTRSPHSRQVGGWTLMSYPTTYQRTPIDRTKALANIGKTILLANHEVDCLKSDEE